MASSFRRSTTSPLAKNHGSITCHAPAIAEPAIDTRSISLALLAGGALASIAALIIMMLARPGATVHLRSVTVDSWTLLIPPVAATLAGVYAARVHKVRRAENAAQILATVGVLLSLLFLRMAYSILA